MRAPVGIRIRRQRMDRGISQAGLARMVGISSSYLNLIENSKRDVGGALLLRIAEHLQLDIDSLSGDQEQKTLQNVQEMLNDPVLQGLDFGHTDFRDLLARFPEVAQALIRLHRMGAEAMAEVEAFTNRFASDPLLGQMLHEVLNRLTGMRSSAEIIARVEDLSETDRHRFTAAINREAQELSTTMRGLVGYFDRATIKRRTISPVRQVEDAFIAANNHFPELEDLADELRAAIPGEFGETALAACLERRFGVRCQRRPETPGGPPPAPAGPAQDGVLWLRASAPLATRVFRMCRHIAELAAPELLDRTCAALEPASDEARQLMRGALSSYVAGAMMMPYARISATAAEHRHDIDLLSHIHGASFEQVAHRLVTLRRPGAEGVPFGFLRADPSGRLTKRFPLPGLSLPGGGHGCLLWPIYHTTPAGGVIRQIAEFPNGARFLMIAKSVPKRISTWAEQPLVFSVMLACDIHHADRTVYGQGLNLSDTGTQLAVGPSCQLCIRQNCSHRQEDAPA
ncbi:helix-turn-helix domain-containing protein [Paracoccus alkenifer]|uniref:HTH cro/C1-type domain-containing protein n=1 Tax=Paracoccus alkenifer TaxID=65735 RepID=A0A1H6JZJ5_9RHOB|nr:helix-turn-helix domain-containing protein [Paracoccus alkenifer]SEH68269.1 hypothetical protein SAMN04488075_0764 [Paracoccus alkenifer]